MNSPMTTPDRVTIANDHVRADVAPAEGGRLAQLAFDGTPVLVGFSEGAEPTAWGSYPMVPWAGRIRHGRFTFDGTEHQLPINFEPHAIHGVGFTSRWTIDEVSARSLALRLDLPADERWPFGGTATQRFAIDGPALVMTLTVTAGEDAFPVSFGWHPWFRKPDSMDFRPTAMFRRDAEHVAVDELVDVPPGPWDDCFVNTEPVMIEVDGARLRLTSDCGLWVVYDEPDHATCIEPQTGPPDAFNIAIRRLAAGESTSAWYRIELAT